MTLRLALFDMDGTLVDSQGHIVTSMDAAFAAAGRPAPDRDAVLACIGLSLPLVFERLAPGADHADMLAAYKTHYAAARAKVPAPTFPGIPEALDALGAEPETLVGIATGASGRGLRAMIDAHGFRLATAQCADDHPSKPHPSMIATALAETSVAPEKAVMIGDSTYDMEMARAAGIFALGVAWGYHPPERLRAAGAQAMVETPSALVPALHEIWEN